MPTILSRDEAQALASALAGRFGIAAPRVVR
jgi:hypothetical protein